MCALDTGLPRSAHQQRSLSLAVASRDRPHRSNSAVQLRKLHRPDVSDSQLRRGRRARCDAAASPDFEQDLRAAPTFGCRQRPHSGICQRIRTPATADACTVLGRNSAASVHLPGLAATSVGAIFFEIAQRLPQGRSANSGARKSTNAQGVAGQGAAPASLRGCRCPAARNPAARAAVDARRSLVMCQLKSLAVAARATWRISHPTR